MFPVQIFSACSEPKLKDRIIVRRGGGKRGKIRLKKRKNIIMRKYVLLGKSKSVSIGDTWV